MLGDDMKPTSLIEISGGGLAAVEEDKGKATGGAAPAAGAVAAPAAGGEAAPAGGGGGTPGITKEEVAKHNNKESCWVILNNQVLDVTTFLKDHPGGELAILTFAGKDATEEFDMIHPPDVIDKYLDPKLKLGPVGVAGAASDGAAAPAAAAASGGGGKTAAKKDPWYIGPNAQRKSIFIGGTIGMVSACGMLVHSWAVPFGMAAFFWVNHVGS
jgi:hypothetical protein